MQILFEQKVKMRENCIESSLSIAFSSMSIFFPVGLDNAVRIHDKMQVVHKEMTCDRTKSNVEFDWSNTIQAHEKFPNVHVVQ